MVAKLIMGLIELPVKGLGYCVKGVMDSKTLLQAIRGRNRGGTHGSAKWADWKTLKKLRKPHGFLIGLHFATKIYLNNEQNLIVISARGKGKTQYFIADARCEVFREVHADYLFHDAAGDIQAGTEAMFRALGYKVMVLDQYHPLTKVDPLAQLKPHLVYEFDGQCRDMARLIVEDEPENRQPHFYKFNQKLVKESIAYAVKHDNSSLYEALQNTFNDEKRKKLIERAQLAQVGHEIEAIIEFNGMNGKNNREGQSMRTTAINKLEPWMTEGIKEICKMPAGTVGRGWTFTDIYADKTPWVIYVRTGLRTDAGNFARLIIGNAINEAKMQWNLSGLPLKKGLRIVIDESHILGNCAAVMDVIRELRKAHINLAMTFTDMETLRKTYPEWKVILAGCEQVFMGGGSLDKEWMDHFRALAGKITISSKGKSKSDSGESQSEHEAGTDLADMAFLRTLPYGEVIALLGNCVAHLDKALAKDMKWPTV